MGWSIWGLLIITIVDNDNLEGLGGGHCVRAELFQEDLRIGAVVCLSKEVIQSDFVGTGSLWRVIDGSIEGTQALRSHSRRIADRTDVGAGGSGDLTDLWGCGVDFHVLLSAFHRTEEGVGRLNGVNVFVEVQWKRPDRGADKVSSILVLKDGVLAVQDTLHLADGQSQLDPILGGVVLKSGPLNAIVREPFMDKLQGLIGGLDQFINLSSAQVLAVFVVIWIRDCRMEQASQSMLILMLMLLLNS